MEKPVSRLVHSDFYFIRDGDSFQFEKIKGQSTFLYLPCYTLLRNWNIPPSVPFNPKMGHKNMKITERRPATGRRKKPRFVFLIFFAYTSRRHVANATLCETLRRFCGTAACSVFWSLFVKIFFGALFAAPLMSYFCGAAKTPQYRTKCSFCGVFVAHIS